MSDNVELDLGSAHKFFSADCFNKTWDLLDKAERTPEDDQAMIQTTLASLWHWSQRPDCTDTNRSIGYWQASRVYATVGQADEATRYGRLCLDVSQGDDIGPFFLGYAHEALARAAMVSGNQEEMSAHLAEARRIAETVPDEDSKKMLVADLDTLK